MTGAKLVTNSVTGAAQKQELATFGFNKSFEKLMVGVALLFAFWPNVCYKGHNDNHAGAVEAG
jgi:hypothetical protein